MATVANLLTSARYQLHDTNVNKWPNAELIDYLNRAYRVVNTRLVQINSDLVKTSTTLSTVANVETVALPASMQAIDFLTVDGEKEPLKQVSIAYIENYNNVFSPVANDVPVCFAIYNDYLYLRPIPDTVYSIIIYYYVGPADLTLTDTTPYEGIADEAFISFIVESAMAREEMGTGRQQNAISSLLRMADILFKRRDKTLKRINAYRWEYQGLV